ncbi:MAG TPA: TolC family protein [Steroidobacteraceae bacterium]|nr:TolC family protein [Steroidobacteraceae bacterium]
MFIPFVRHCLAGMLMLVPLASWAATDTSLPGALSLQEAIARTLKGNPELLVFPAAKRVVEAERLQANFRPNPSIDLTAENFVGPSAARDQQQITLTLSHVIELGGKRAYRFGAADAVMGTVEAEYVIARLDALSEMARRFTDTAQSQAEIELADRAVVLAQSSATSVERRIKAGAASTAERNRAQVVLVRARIDAERTRSDLAARRIALAAMWGEQEANFDTVQADLGQLPTLIPIAPILDQLQQSPAFARFAAERRLREAERKLARAQAVPDLTMALGVRRISLSNDYTLVASLSMPLPVHNRNQGEIAAATAKIEVSDAEREAAHLRMRAVLYGLYQEAVQMRARAAAIKNEAIPQAEQALLLTQRGFDNGRFSFLELADAQRQVLELRSQLIEAYGDAHRLDAEIERLIGQPIATSTPIPGEPR